MPGGVECELTARIDELGEAKTKPHRPKPPQPRAGAGRSEPGEAKSRDPPPPQQQPQVRDRIPESRVRQWVSHRLCMACVEQALSEYSRTRRLNS